MWLQFLKQPYRKLVCTGLGWSVLSASMNVVSAEFDDPSALVVLAEEELVVIDLKSAGWPAVHPPYLASLHCSAITCSHHVSNIPLKLWERIISAGSKQNIHYSSMVWQLCPPLCPPVFLRVQVSVTAHGVGGLCCWWSAEGSAPADTVLPLNRVPRGLFPKQYSYTGELKCDIFQALTSQRGGLSVPSCRW